MKKPTIKSAALAAFSGIVLGLLAFLYNYTLVPLSLPGYELITAPAMFLLQFFNEETPFWPKMLIFITGQYLGYFALIVGVLKINSALKR